MNKTARVEARIEAELKHAAETVFSQLGVSPSDAIRMFYKQVELRQGFPFEICIPNAETVAAIKEVEEHPEKLRRHESVDEMFDAWDLDVAEC
ncbi:MAG: type II toxin-antitoxin system RelB/DinJ family antitoxin [Thermosynechococcaceae cyanobacterium]